MSFVEDLLAKYGQLRTLTQEEEAAFRSLTVKTRDYKAGTDLIAGQYDEPDHLFLVESGRLFASCELENGQRAITRLYFAGDIMGTANIPFEKATHTITAQSDATLYAFPRQKLIEAFTKLPRVAAIFYTFAALENATLNDRLVSIGRTRGKARLASLILEISARRSMLAARSEDSFPIGLTQAQIGDAIGLTEVQVNRLFRDLDKDKVIERSNGHITITDRDRLARIGVFRDRYNDLDLDWFDEEMK